jgi:hypothetical protein
LDDPGNSVSEVTVSKATSTLADMATCSNCGAVIRLARPSNLYCTPRCRHRAWVRRRQSIAPLPNDEDVLAWFAAHA